MEAAEANYPDFPEDFDVLPYRWTEFSGTPVLGDPTAATADKGAAILSAVVATVGDALRRLHARSA
jgi:creatinine amidohydrolase